MKAYLGIDVGSVSTNLAILDERGEVVSQHYLLTHGQPIQSVQKGLREIAFALPEYFEIRGVGTTGSARKLTGLLVGADVIKNEITAHAMAAVHFHPDVRTVIEIGGQDSKIIIVRDGLVIDFGMNTVCAAGTGSFLDQQALRLSVPIATFGDYALRSESPVRIAGRCTVFAESDMVHKQQMGCNLSDIIAGLCEALVRNYLNNVAKGKDIQKPILFQGGVAANLGIKQALERELGTGIYVPRFYAVMGAIGSALLAREKMDGSQASGFKGFRVVDMNCKTRNFFCKECENTCEVVEFIIEERPVSYWGDRCGKWEAQAKTF
ncbi:MAG: acyl-CoA dehydratase activase [Thermodesulfobacteriota bacterium]|nr:acyl-CoA dehydratase activase [Thermodesulfobacteriota bacterium]